MIIGAEFILDKQKNNGRKSTIIQHYCATTSRSKFPYIDSFYFLISFLLLSNSHDSCRSEYSLRFTNLYMTHVFLFTNFSNTNIVIFDFLKVHSYYFSLPFDLFFVFCHLSRRSVYIRFPRLKRMHTLQCQVLKCVSLVYKISSFSLALRFLVWFFQT